ncbi:MAG TPA: fumarate hydratase [Methanothermobacter sp.]|jgi:fumarate hydratase subunit alpha|uniref:Fumarate hydratase n=1 Tax=Methanothermobacter tenebrarum TaxID=680118 RepID=A0ABN6PCY6_9EURY|nr:fumarate hydratase [Methanothermobacter tenebrarum]MBK6586524.1 fumarate hydratase [Coprothermobacter sp.]MDD3453916.1 fumarate hydratase [Methanobacteriales archaeon]MDI6882157.1 fumarate hydratase [Methanothermobacter sp.]MDX9692775.1 fumarate hydratase [Methanothermobacter sp.]BDH80082.1 fumarate hydratase [Methanothermobacter tenebrarum]
MISQKKIEETVCQLFKKATTRLPSDVESALKKALQEEEDEIALLNLNAILENIKIAKEKKIPICQDTGLPIVFVKMGNVKVEKLYEGIREGIRKATSQVPLRPNVVDPISRENTGDNTGKMIPQIDLELADTDFLEITVMPKGFGSENNNRLRMGLPSEGLEGVKDFVIETVIRAGGKPCPPIIVGVGVGGSSDLALKLAKKALLKKIGERNKNKKIAELEESILQEINRTGIGPMGLGGKTTALDVKIETAHTHTAGLPIGVCIQCWASRHATAILK